MNTFISHRQMGEVEAIYNIFPNFHFKDSNVACVFVPTARQVSRSKFLQRTDIQKVKSQVMEYLENAEEARLMVSEDMKNNKIGKDLDPEFEQEIEDCETEGIEVYEDYSHLDPDILNLPKENENTICTFRPETETEKIF